MVQSASADLPAGDQTVMRRVGVIIVLVAALGAMRAGAAAGPADSWTYLIEKLADDGVPRAWAERVFDDPRMPPFDQLDFSLSPREPASMYRGLLSPRSVSAAYECFATHIDAFDRAERQLGVPGNV